MSTSLRNLISPSLRFELREAATFLERLLKRACFWQWEFVKLPRRGGSAYDILYLGRKEKRKQAMALLGIDSDLDADQASSDESPRRVFVSEMPTLGALRVPQSLSVVVPLGRSLDELTASYDKELRRLIRKQRANYSIRNVVDEADIDRIDREMIKPYATARHHDSAAHVDLDTVRKLAQPELGRLDVFYSGEEEVACQLGCTLVRNQKRYWSVVRFGCPEAVYSERKRLGEANAMTDYLGVEWAIDNGFDYYDLGTCLARPDGGLLQWKKRRKGTLDTMGNHGYFYVRLPKVGVAQFLWDAPLFSVKRGNLSLHLGIPEGPNDEEVAIRYREMGFSGLSKVYLHCERPLGENVLEKFHVLYSSERSPTIVETIPVNR